MARSTRNRESGGVAESEPEARDSIEQGTDRPEPGGPAAPAPSAAYDDIARRAYELYQQRGAADGQEVDDWLRAEAELKEARGRRDDEV